MTTANSIVNIVLGITVLTVVQHFLEHGGTQ